MPTRSSIRIQHALVSTLPVVFALLISFAVVRGGVALLAVLGLAACAVAVVGFSLRPQDVFLAWIAVAPFLQSTFGASRSGHALRIVLYSAPPLLLAAATLLQRRSIRGSLVDLVPFGYLGVAALSAEFSASSVSPTQLYSTVAIGIIVYYFCAFGPLDDAVVARLFRILLVTGSVVAAFVILGRAGIGLGSATRFQVDYSASAERASATFGNPAVLGTFLGAALVVSLAVLVWNGPRSLRPLSWLTAGLTPPALFLTLTRAPLIAALAVGLLVVALRSRTRWGTVLACALCATVLVGMWGAIASTSLYKTRFSNTTNVQARVIIDRWSIKLAEQRPVLGWGYGSFDRVKNAARFSAGPLPRADVIQYTSHNTFLTVLVETGAVGLALFIIPWVVVTRGAIRLARRPTDEKWLIVGLLAVLGVWIVNAGAIDMRFFSFISALPWLAAGLLRRHVLDGERVSVRPAQLVPDLAQAHAS
jgi:O-antigen ligase